MTANSSHKKPPIPRGARRDLNDVYCFARVVQLASFSRAADDFGVSPSAVSRRIARLERAIGATLLLRSAHAVRLTSAGRAYFERVVSAFERIEGAPTNARDLRLDGATAPLIEPERREGGQG